MLGLVSDKMQYFDDGDGDCYFYGEYDDHDHFHDTHQHFERPTANMWGSVSNKMNYYDDGDAQLY